MQVQGLRELKIISDGTGRTTRIVDSEGKDIIDPKYLRGVSWSVEGPGPARVTIELVPARVALAQEPEWLNSGPCNWPNCSCDWDRCHYNTRQEAEHAATHGQTGKRDVPPEVDAAMERVVGFLGKIAL